MTIGMHPSYNISEVCTLVVKLGLSSGNVRQEKGGRHVILFQDI
jgi:hypothetical protein